MNFKKLLPLAALLLFAAGCNKSDSLTDNALPDGSKSDPHGSNGTNVDITTSRQPLATYSTNDPGLEPLRKMFSDHEKYHATVEP